MNLIFVALLLTSEEITETADKSGLFNQKAFQTLTSAAPLAFTYELVPTLKQPMAVFKPQQFPKVPLP
jgi:hypothetical protein